MPSPHDATVHLRLPRDLRADLDQTARAAGVKLSVVTRNALAVGLAAIRSDNDRDPPPSAPGGVSGLLAAA